MRVSFVNACATILAIETQNSLIRDAACINLVFHLAYFSYQRHELSLRIIHTASWQLQRRTMKHLDGNCFASAVFLDGR
jgi:hypothetical protein